MFVRLWHDAFIGSDDEQRRVNSPNAREHILNEVTMTRHIHNPNFLPIGKHEPAKAKLDGHFTRLFFFETVRMYTRQRRNKRGLSMIYMTCCTDNAHRISKTLRRFQPSQGYHFFVFFIALP